MPENDLPNSSNVSNARPSYTGAVFSAPVGTRPPENASDELSDDFRGYGYISDEGLANEFETDSEQIEAFGGDEVLSVQTSYAETFTQGFLEENVNTKRAFFGDDNVFITDEGFAAIHSSAELPYLTWVWDVRLTGGRKKRIVIFEAKVDEREGVEHTHGEATIHSTTLRARPVNVEINGERRTGVTAVEYIVDATVADDGNDDGNTDNGDEAGNE